MASSGYDCTYRLILFPLLLVIFCEHGLVLLLLHFLTLSVLWESEETGFINLERTIKQDCSVTVFSHQDWEACSLGSLLPFCSSMKLALLEWPHFLWSHNYSTRHATGRWDSIDQQTDLLYSLMESLSLPWAPLFFTGSSSQYVLF